MGTGYHKQRGGRVEINGNDWLLLTWVVTGVKADDNLVFVWGGAEWTCLSSCFSILGPGRDRVTTCSFGAMHALILSPWCRHLVTPGSQL